MNNNHNDDVDANDDSLQRKIKGKKNNPINMHMY
jgi:hypothetical protein